jgi:glycosyltransferase involved in cell wall biosynthesis
VIIGVDIREWQPGRRTGIGRFLEVFLRAAALARPLDRFLLFGDPTCEVRVRADNVSVVRMPEPWTLWWDQVVLPRALARSRVDAFYSPYIKVPLLAPMPVVSTIHDLTFFLRWSYNRRRLDLLMNPPFRLFCRLVVRRAAAIIVDSEASSRDVRRLLHPDPSRIRVVPLATSAAYRPQPDPQPDAAVWARYGLRPGYILYVGNFWPHKNVPQVIRAHTSLPDRLRIRHPLILAGGSASPAVAGLLKDARIAAMTRNLGPIAEADLPALYRGAALFVFPSHYEGFGLPVLEAMACGIPVLCSSTPALVELTSDAAEHVAPEDTPGWEQALCALLEDPKRRCEMAKSGCARAALFTRERMAECILSVLDEAVRRPH